MNMETGRSDILVKFKSLFSDPIEPCAGSFTKLRKESVSLFQKPVVSKNLLYGPVRFISLRMVVAVDNELYWIRSNASFVARRFIANTGEDSNILAIVLWKNEPLRSSCLSNGPKMASRSFIFLRRTCVLTGPFLEEPMTRFVIPSNVGLTLMSSMNSSKKIPGFLYFPICTGCAIFSLFFLFLLFIYQALKTYFF